MKNLEHDSITWFKNNIFGNHDQFQGMLRAVIQMLRTGKGPLVGLRQFLAAESPLKMKKNAFFHVKSSFRS